MPSRILHPPGRTACLGDALGIDFALLGKFIGVGVGKFGGGESGAVDSVAAGVIGGVVRDGIAVSLDLDQGAIDAGVVGVVNDVIADRVIRSNDQNAIAGGVWRVRIGSGTLVTA